MYYQYKEQMATTQILVVDCLFVKTSMKMIEAVEDKRRDWSTFI